MHRSKYRSKGQLKGLWQLMRFDRPIGIWLLMWPVWWALWIVHAGMPSWRLLIIFTLGTVLMRAAGCVANDLADRHWDGAVARTAKRPLVTGVVSINLAKRCLWVLLALSFSLLIWLNWPTRVLAVVGAGLALGYPYLKRVTHWPQLGLGVAFSWSILMVYTASLGHVPPIAWALFALAIIWPVMYDTEYAMVDREDDLKVGIKSTAVLWQAYDRLGIGVLQLVFLLGWVLLAKQLEFKPVFGLAWLGVCGLFGYQQWLLKSGHQAYYLKAFLNNHYVGGLLFIGIAVQYLL